MQTRQVVRSLRLVIFVAVLTSLMWVTTAMALPNQVPQTGIITNPQGAPVNGEYTVTVRLYDSLRRGELLFEEAHPAVEVVEGRYSVMIGSIEALPANLFARDQVYFTVALDADEEMTPRLPLAKVPAAFHADTAINVTGNINPTSVAIDGQIVINDQGEWIGAPTGLRGPVGPPGEAGPAGPAGPVGALGPQGPPGQDGRDGVAGQAGVDGMGGQNGLNGQDGQDADPADVVPLVVDALTADPDALPYVRGDIDAAKSGHLTMQPSAALRFEAASPVYNAITLSNHNLVGANRIQINDAGAGEGIQWGGSQARIHVSPLDGSNADGFLRLTNDEGISLESSVRVAGSMAMVDNNITAINTLHINDPGPTEGLIFLNAQAKIVVSPLDGSNSDGMLRLINDEGISMESNVRVAGNIDMVDRNISAINTLHINDPGPTEGLIFNGSQAKVVVSPLDGGNSDGWLRLINDEGISLESNVRIAGNIDMVNRNISAINSLLINDPGPTEGLIFSGTQAKVVVSPLDDGNTDGYLRLVNDEGISLESTVRMTGNLTMEAGASISLRDQPISGASSLTIADPGPDGAILWSGTQAQIYVSPLDNGNTDGYLRLKNDGGISLESNTRIDGDLSVNGKTVVGMLTHKSAQTTRHKGVVDLLHPPGGYVRGQEWAWRYYHIRTPDTAGNGEMFRYDLTGYSYGIAQPISFTWVGYLYSGNRRLIQQSAINNHPSNRVGVSHYQGTDGHLYLKFGPIRQYYTGFVLDYMSGSTRERVDHSSGGYQVILTPNNVQL